MDRRTLVTGLMGASCAALVPGLGSNMARAAGLPADKIKRIRYFRTPTDAAGRADPHQPTFNQSTNIVLVETQSGLVGVGEGGSADMMEQCAGLLIGQDPFRIEDLWQIMYRSYFYPAGREKIHALGALNVALWDLKAKALGVPLYQLLGGKTREYVECYATGFPMATRTSQLETARACIEAGFRAYRIAPPGPAEFDRFQKVQDVFELCKQVREGVGKDGAFALDFHTEFDMPDAVTLANLIEPLHPYFCEDLLRSENPEVYKTLRPQVKVPIAVGEQFGGIWDCNVLVENQLIDYARVTVPNVGGVSEYMKIVALCETHYVGLIPHFTGPVSEATLVHCLAANTVPAVMEMTGGGKRVWPYLNQSYDFKNGKLWVNDRPGIGVDVDIKKLTPIAEYTEHYAPIQYDHRPDGSYTNW
jgi:galactonate dehydratase